MKPLSPLTKLGHVALVTHDLDRSLWFWRDVIGLEEADHDGDTVFLRAWGDVEHHTLSLAPGARSQVDHIAFRVRSNDELGSIVESLTARGVTPRWVQAGEEKGQGLAVRFDLPTGHRIELYHDVERARPPLEQQSPLKTNSARAWARGVSPRRIDHVNVTTTSPGGTRTWLTDELGFRTRELIRREDGSEAAVWMGVSALSHDLAVMTDAGGRTDGFHHLAYWLDDAQDILRASDILRENGIQIDGGPGRHGVSQAIFSYVRDPGSGHRLELFSGGYLVLDDDWETVEWSGEELPVAMTWWGSDVSILPAMDGTTDFGVGTRSLDAF